MPAPTNPTLWTHGHPYSYRGFLYILSPDVVYSARVNQSEFTYPLAEVTFDGGSGTLADVQIGMMITFGSSAGSYDRGWQIIQAVPTSTVLKIGWSSQGDLEGEVDLDDNTFITVYDFYPAMHKLLRIEPDGEIFKFYNLDFATYGAVTPPVSNSGIYYAGFVDADDEITVDFPGDHSFTTDPTADGELTHLWDFADGTPSSSTSANPTGVVFPTGKRNVRHTVTDSNGKSHTSIVHVAALEQPGGTFVPILDFDVTQDQITQQGHQMSFFVKEDIPVADYPIGTLVIYFEKEFFGDAYTGSLPGITQAGREHVKFVGFLETASEGVRGSREGAIRDCTIQCVDFMGRAKAITSREQELEHVETPSTWTHMYLPNLDRYFHYLLHWHSTLLELTDFSWSGVGTYYPFTRLNSDKSNLYEQINAKAKAIQHLFTSDSRGRLFIRPDKFHLDVAGDSAATVVTRSGSSTGLMALTEDHYTKFEQGDKRPSVGVLNGSAIRADTYTTEPLFCYSPGRAPGVGANESEAGRRLVYNQAELNAQTGHMYKRANAPENLWGMDLVQGGDGGFEPGLLDLIVATRNTPWIPQRGRAINAARYLVTALNIRHSNNDQQTKSQSLTLEKETIGLPAVTVTYPAVGETPNPVPSQPVNPPYPYGGNDEVPYFVINPVFIPPPTYPPVTTPNPQAIPAGTVVIWTNSQVWYSKFYRTQRTLAKLAWKEITPEALQEGELIGQFAWGHAEPGGFLIANPDVVATHFYATDNVLSGEWDDPTEVDGGYSVIRVPEVKDAAYIYSPLAEDLVWSETIDLTDTLAGVFTIRLGSQTLGVGISGAKGTAPASAGGAGALTNNYYRIVLDIDLTAADTITDMNIIYDRTNPVGAGTAVFGYEILNNATSLTGPVAGVGNGTNLNVGTSTDFAAGVVRYIITSQRFTPDSEGTLLAKTLVISGTGVNPFDADEENALVRHTNNRGETFGTERIIGISPGSEGGFDTVKIQPGALGAAIDEIGKTTTAGGAYSEYAALSDPAKCIVIPRYKLGSTSTSNAVEEPDFVFGVGDLLAGTTIYAVEGGETPTADDITPIIESELGRAGGANVMAMPWISGKKLAALLGFGSTVHLVTMIDLGTDNTWVDRESFGAPGNEYLRMRKGDKSAKELYFVTDGDLYYSPDFGATILGREKPTEDDIVGIEVYG